MSTFAQVEEKKEKQNKVSAPPVKETVQRDLSEVNGPEGGMLPGEVSQKIQSMRGSGQKLSDRQNQYFSQKFGRDMSDVHVHTDAQSDTISRSLNARAFTIGSDVFLTKGINPEGGGSSMETMTHELTHVVQQGGHASSGPLKLGAADTAQEHEAEATAQREFDPKLKEDDAVQRQFEPKYQAENTIQRGFWSDLGSAALGSVFNAIGIGDAMNDFMAGDKKVKTAIGKMGDDKKVEYRGVEEEIKRLEETYIPDLEKEVKGYQKQIQRLEGDPNMIDEIDRLQEQMESAQQALDGRKNDLDVDLKKQLSMLQAVDATITTDDINRYRSGKAKTFFSSIFSSIGGSVLSAFESDPDKKEAAKAKGRNSINSWWASANKTSLESENEEEKAERVEQRQKALVDDLWNEVEQNEQLHNFYSSKLLFKREIIKSHMTLIQESIKDNESDNDIKQAVLTSLRQNAESAAAKQQSSAQQNQQGVSA